MKLTYDEYRTYREGYEGYCPDCDEITRSQTEPDAQGYDCPACGGQRVMGIEDAMMMGDVEIVD